MSLPTLTV